MRVLRLGLTLLALLACGTAAAQGESSARGYVFGGWGPVRVHLDCVGTTVCDGRDIAVHFGAGAWLPWSLAGGRLALEGRWAEFGDAQLANASIDARLSNHALMLGAAWHRPLAAGLSAYVGAGVARVSTGVVATPTGGTTATGSDAHVTGYGALGLQHAFGPGATLDLQALWTRARYERAGLELGRGHVSALLLGVTQRF